MTTEARRAYQAAWRKSHRESVNASKRKYMATHPEAKQKQREYHAEWQRKNPDKVKAAQQRHKEKTLSEIFKEGDK